jgi:hypothetical protein
MSKKKQEAALEVIRNDLVYDKCERLETKDRTQPQANSRLKHSKIGNTYAAYA